jgi:ribosomal protein S30
MLRGKHLDMRVKRLLNEDKKYQTSDLALVARIWFDDIEKITYGSIHEVTAIKLLDMLRNGDLTKSESITRCRRKIQEKEPSLRDTNVYKGRVEKAREMRASKQYY